MKTPNIITKDLAYFLGSMRDGSLIYSKDKKYWIRVYDNKDSNWLETISDISKKLFDINFHLRYQRKINAKYLDISCRKLFDFISELCDGNLHGDVPEIIKKSEMEIKKAYIAGFFDAEGYVPYPTVKNKRFRITFNQKDTKSLLFIKETLENIGIKCCKITRHILPIYGKENLIKFYNSFNLRHLEKKMRLRKLVIES